MKAWKWRLRLRFWKSDLQAFMRSVRFNWWRIAGFPSWPSLDAVQASKFGLTPVTVVDDAGLVDRVLSVDFQSGEVIRYTGRLSEYYDREAETVGKFYAKVEFFPSDRLVVCHSVYRGGDHHTVRKN